MDKFRTTTDLNVRTGPGVQFTRIKTIPKGTTVETIPFPNWCQIGPDQWVNQEFLEEITEPVVTKSVSILQSRLPDLFGKPRDPAPYLKIMDFKEFKNHFYHVKDYLGNPFSYRIYGHEMMESPLRQAFKNLIDRGFATEWKTYEGCLNIERYSPCHNYGMAIDLNAGSNGYGKKPTLSAGFVKCFTDAGFEWGGTWQKPDGMHFQLPRTK